MKRFAVLCVLAGVVAPPIAAQSTKYGVTVKAADNTDFSKFKTYTWEHGWQTYDKAVNEQIITSIDRELAGVGLTRRESGTADVIVTYASLWRIDVDLNAKSTTADGKLPQYDVGTLVVLLLEPGSRKELFRGRVDQPIEVETNKVKAVVDAAVKDMFAKYPTRRK